MILLNCQLTEIIVLMLQCTFLNRHTWNFIVLNFLKRQFNLFSYSYFWRVVYPYVEIKATNFYLLTNNLKLSNSGELEHIMKPCVLHSWWHFKNLQISLHPTLVPISSAVSILLWQMNVKINYTKSIASI